MSDAQQIKDAIGEFILAYNGGNLDGVLACYAQDLIKTRQGATPESKTQTAERVADVFKQFDSRVDVGIDEIEVSGDMAFTRGTFRVTLTPKSGGEPITIDRRYLEIWRRQSGRWLVARTMDNS